MYLEKKDACTPVSLAVLFTIGKTWQQPKCHPQLRGLVLVYSELLLGHKKE